MSKSKHEIPIHVVFPCTSDAIADVLDVARVKELLSGSPTSIRWIAERFTAMLSLNNPGFDRKRFLEACGYPQITIEH